ncbi:MAG: RDD family protein [Nitrospirae bacterium]|nr:RDD family protein [Nitrospirota bacterium]
MIVVADDESHPEQAEEFPKADGVHRFIAKFIDFLIVAALARLIHPVGFFAGMTYLLIADGLYKGQSIGKRLIGLETLRTDRRTAASFRESIVRNIPFSAAYLCGVVPYIGWMFGVGIMTVESLLVIGNLHGRRVGDEIAKTQVVDQRPSAPDVHPGASAMVGS